MDFKKFTTDIGNTFPNTAFVYEVDPHGHGYAAKDLEGYLAIFYGIDDDRWGFILADDGKPFAKGNAESPADIRRQLEELLNKVGSAFGFTKEAVL